MAGLDRWNERYRAGEGGPGSPAALVVEAAGGLTPGRALDLACGTGRNALWLAARGWDVVAIDGATAAVERLREAEPRIEARVLDLEREPLPFSDATFDLICIIHFLHRPLFAVAQRLLRPGGMVVASIHTTRSTMNPRYTLAPGELRSFFADWALVIDREGEVAEIAATRVIPSAEEREGIPCECAGDSSPSPRLLI